MAHSRHMFRRGHLGSVVVVIAVSFAAIVAGLNALMTSELLPAFAVPFGCVVGCHSSLLHAGGVGAMPRRSVRATLRAASNDASEGNASSVATVSPGAAVPIAAAAADPALADVKLQEEEQESEFADQSVEDRKLTKQALLSAIVSLERGFAATEAEREEVNKKIADLAKLSPEAEPSARLGGEWTLLYTDAPDILGIPSGPLARIKRIGQEIDASAKTITNVIEYEPSPLASGVAGIVGGTVDEDSLVQRVITEYNPVSAVSVDLKIRGLSITPTRVFGFELPDMLRLKADGPLSLPFGNFDILYMDDDLRIVRTRQGWCSINRRGSF